MGLDMYLYAEKSFSNASNDFVEKFPEYAKEVQHYKALMSATDMDLLPSAEYGSATVTKCVGYWRKANAIHGWIVRNLADGIDECQRIDMGREDIVNLRDVCVKALNNRHEALPIKEPKSKVIKDTGDENSIVDSITNAIKQESLKKHEAVALADPLELEPTAGFFFGGTEKDEYYYADIERTVDTLNSLLAGTVGEDYRFYYQASW